MCLCSDCSQFERMPTKKVSENCSSNSIQIRISYLIHLLIQLDCVFFSFFSQNCLKFLKMNSVQFHRHKNRSKIGRTWFATKNLTAANSIQFKYFLFRSKVLALKIHYLMKWQTANSQVFIHRAPFWTKRSASNE